MQRMLLEMTDQVSLLWSLVLLLPIVCAGWQLDSA